MILLKPSIARAARAYTGLTQIALARSAGVATRTIFKLEDDGGITPDSMDKISDALGRHGVAMLRDARGKVYGLTFDTKR